MPADAGRDEQGARTICHAATGRAICITDGKSDRVHNERTTGRDAVILLSGSANAALAGRVAERLGTRLAACVLERFPDGELHVEIRESVRGQRVYILQPSSPPVEAHLFEILLLADACRRAGAAQMTAVMPYFGYARQDRRAVGRDPIAARVAADVLAACHIDDVVVVDLHSRASEGLFSMPAQHLSAVPLLADAIRSSKTEGAVLVAPDLGAVRLAQRYSRSLDLPVATIHKTRVSGREVKIQQLVGEVRDRSPIIVDDLLSTGGTVAAAVRALLAAGCVPDISVVVTHGLFAHPAEEVLRSLPIARLVTTDSIAPRADMGLPVNVVSLAPLLEEVVRRLDRDESLGDLISHG
jgi:ribose-phosphate pyrophosphokinase